MAKVKSDFPVEQWNKKRLIVLIIALGVLIVGGLELKNYLLGSDSPEISNFSTQKNVKGASISPVPTISLPTAKDIGQNLEGGISNIKNELNNIKVQEIATSSPQVQKVLNDIKELPSVPGKEVCSSLLKLCNGL